MYAASYVWAKIFSYMEKYLGEVVTSAWFDDAEAVSLTETELIIYSPSEFRQDRIRAHCAPYIEEALKKIFQSNAKLVVWGETERKAQQNKQDHGYYFHSQFVFENFVAGSVNALPLKIALAVAANPGDSVYNPVFFYGPPGVGKTHLLYSIANEIAKQEPQKKIVCIKGDQFTNDLVNSIRIGNMVQFREKYREADVLLIDDIQFIAGKESTQQEFYHTFNELYENGKQIVLAADRKPSEMATLEERLQSRFGVGIMIGVQLPDLETRAMITKAKSKKMCLDLNAEIIHHIAASLTDNIRQIEGALKKIRALRDLAGMELTLENVVQAIEDIGMTEKNAVITPGLIVRNVCRYYGVDEDTLKGPQRSRNVSEPRQMAMYLMRQMINMSQDEIAKVFSRERTTVVHALKQVEKIIQVKGNRLDPILQDLQANIAASY